MVSNDQEVEVATVRAYNQAIGLAHEVADQVMVDLLLRILKMEEGYADWAEMQHAPSWEEWLRSWRPDPPNSQTQRYPEPRNDRRMCLP